MCGCSWTTSNVLVLMLPYCELCVRIVFYSLVKYMQSGCET